MAPFPQFPMNYAFSGFSANGGIHSPTEVLGHQVVCYAGTHGLLHLEWGSVWDLLVWRGVGDLSGCASAYFYLCYLLARFFDLSLVSMLMRVGFRYGLMVLAEFRTGLMVRRSWAFPVRHSGLLVAFLTSL